MLARKSRECEAELSLARQGKLLFEAKAAFASRHCLRLREMTQAVSALAARFVAHAEALLRAATPPGPGGLPYPSSRPSPAEEAEILAALRASKRALERALREQYEAHLALEHELRSSSSISGSGGSSSTGGADGGHNSPSSPSRPPSPSASRPPSPRRRQAELLPRPSTPPPSHFVPLPSPEALGREEARAMEQRRRLAEERQRMKKLTGELASQKDAIDVQMQALAEQVALSRRVLEQHKGQLQLQHQHQHQASGALKRPASAPTLPYPLAPSLAHIKKRAHSKRLAAGAAVPVVAAASGAGVDYRLQRQLEEQDRERQREVVERAIAAVAQERAAEATGAFGDEDLVEEARHLRELRRRLLAHRRDADRLKDPVAAELAAAAGINEPLQPPKKKKERLESIDKAAYISTIGSLKQLERRRVEEKMAAAKHQPFPRVSPSFR